MLKAMLHGVYSTSLLPQQTPTFSENKSVMSKIHGNFLILLEFTKFKCKSCEDIVFTTIMTRFLPYLVVKLNNN